MAKRPKAPTATDSLRPGTPMPIKVQEDGEQIPVAVSKLLLSEATGTGVR